MKHIPELTRIDLSFYRNAFCCGEKNKRGLHADFYIEEDEIRGEYIPAPDLCGYPNIVHGGILATLLDEAMFWAATRANKKFCYAVSVNVRYKQPVAVGEHICIRARHKEWIRNIAVIEGTILNKDGKIAVKSEGKYFPFTDQQDAKARKDMQIYENGYPF